MQVWRNGSVNGAQEFRLVSYKCGHFVIPLKRQPQNALAAVAGCAKKEDFHNRRSSAVCCAIGFSPLVFQSCIAPLPTSRAQLWLTCSDNRLGRAHVAPAGLVGIVFISPEERGPSGETQRLPQLDCPGHQFNAYRRLPEKFVVARAERPAF